MAGKVVGLRFWLVRRWRRPTLTSRFLLTPPAALFGLLVRLRRIAWRRGWLQAQRLPVPVVVVGNLSVGGSGKTPLVIHLVKALRETGYSPGVVSRGYGGVGGPPRRLDANADPTEVGDEPALIQWATGCPVAVGADRAAAARCLVTDCDIVLADDGLQHYVLGRDIEIAVIDADAGVGNGHLLPAGPLREPASRLQTVDFTVVRDGDRDGAWRIDIHAGGARRVDGSGAVRPLADFVTESVHAVAGIGVPERFFSQLERAGLTIERHGFADHHAFDRADLAFADERPVLMTRKDAVKCRRFADARLWYLDAEVNDRDGLVAALRARIDALPPTGSS